MRSLRIGDVTITSIIERDGPWRQPEAMFPAYDPDLGPANPADPFPHADGWSRGGGWQAVPLFICPVKEAAHASLPL